MAQNNLARQIKHLILQVQCQESRTHGIGSSCELGILSLSKIAECWKGTLYVVRKARMTANI